MRPNSLRALHDSLHCSAQLSKKDEEILAHLTEIECKELEEEEDEDLFKIFSM